MTSTTSKNWRDWPDPQILNDTVYSRDPVGILRGLKKAARYGRVAFHTAELEAAAGAWGRAAMAFPRDSVKQRECFEQSAKFSIWRTEILNGQMQYGEIGVMTIEPHDWPPPQLNEEAIAALEKAQIRTIIH